MLTETKHVIRILQHHVIKLQSGAYGTPAMEDLQVAGTLHRVIEEYYQEPTEMYDIIATDNYNREDRSDFIVAIGIASKATAETMTKALNAQNPDGDRYYKTVDRDYKLFKFNP